MQDRRFNPPPAPSTPKEAPWREIEELIAGERAIVQRLDALLSRMGAPTIVTPTPGPAPGPVIIPPPSSTTFTLIPNRHAFMTGQKDVATAGKPEQLDAMTIPNGYALIIIAKPGNTGNIYISGDQANVSDSKRRFDALQPGLAVALHVDNLSAVWADAAVDGEGISWIVEV